MLYVVLFEDNPGLGVEVRRNHMSAHLAFLERNADHIMSAGPLKSPSDEPAGGIWLVEAESVDAVDALVKADPFWPTGLRKSVRILKWQQVFADGRRLV
ncbi:MAG TPA: YciI family protein [Alphaproteobacteria bacterium]|nr:YciI family protein [Alphaproteobacteria bacterium]